MSEIPAAKSKDPSPVAAQGADRIQRLIAAIIDGVAMAVIMVPLLAVLWFMGMWPESQILSSIFGTILGGATFVAVNYMFLKEGQTIGKKVMNLRIVGRDDQLKSVDHLLLKRYAPVWAAGLVPYIGPLLGLANVLCIFRESRACLHDDIAETKVVSS